MTQANHPLPPNPRALRRAVLLTRLGMAGERATRSFWPLWSLLLVALAPLMMGAQDAVSPRLFWAIAGLWMLASFAALIHGLRHFRWPTMAAARTRLDETLPGRPLAALDDSQAIGARDAASRAVWLAHRARMAARLKRARAVAPDLKISRFDPFALRYMALLAFVVALIFGGFGRVATLGDLAPGGGARALAAGPDWEGWVKPPTYTGKPGLYLSDLIGKPLRVPVGSVISLRFYAGADGKRLHETVSQTPPTGDDANALSFTIARSGRLEISGRGGAQWQLIALPDQPPTVALDGPLERQARGKMSQPFAAQDDYGVTGGQAVFTLDMGQIARRYGLATPPDPRPPLVLDLPMPINGSRADFRENLVDDLSKHPWSGLPVTMILQVSDAREQTGHSQPAQITLPGRRFFDPLAAAVIEQRRDLLWARANGARVAQVLRALIARPEGFVRNQSGYLMLRVAIARLEAGVKFGLTEDVQTEVSDALWQIATLFEDGALSDARQRMQRAQDRLSQAMKNGASDAEIADLMQELRDATKDYLRQLAEQQQGDKGNQQNAQNQQGQQITQEQIQALMDKLQELMQQGRMAEAQALMEQFNRMMQNLRMTQNQQGGKGQNPGQQAMKGLKDTLRQQQGLSDQAFQDLQRQFSPQDGQEGGQPGNDNGPPQPGQQGQGQGRDQTQGQGQGKGQDQAQGQNPGQGSARDLARRQQALREQLGAQQRNLPGAGTAEGKAARKALEGAGKAMERAGKALQGQDLAEALDQQAQAMEALREGMRGLDRALARQQQQRQPGGQQGQTATQAGRDPLGRDGAGSGRIGVDNNLLQGKDVYRRARDLLEELRRRSGQRSRPKMERDYLKRLLEKY